MRLVSFNVFRTLGLPDVVNLKPELFLQNPMSLRPVIENADWILFPEYWQLNSLLYGMDCRIFPSEASYRIGHDKVEMTRVVQGLRPDCLPFTLIAANTAEEAERLWEAMTLPFVAKRPKDSMGQGVWLIEDRRQWQDYLARSDILYVQEYLPIDRDLRIVRVGDETLTAYWRLRSGYSFHTNVARGGEVCFDEVPGQALELVQWLATRLDIDHAGFDVAMVGGRPYLLEFNRLFGNRGIPGGGRAISAAILGYLQKHQPDFDPCSPNVPPQLDVG